MAVPNSFTDISTTAASNPPAGSDAKTTADDHMRQIYAFLKSLYEGSTGGQIVFPATQNASSNANTLDDYEEANYTPADSSGATLTLSTAVGSYTKIGRLVMVRAAIVFPTTADTSAAKISVPIASRDYGVNSGLAVARTNYGDFISVEQVYNTSYVQFYSKAGVLLTNADLSGKLVYFSGCYEA